MDFKFANNLFLGRQELDFFEDSLKIEGYIKTIQQFMRSYGIVRDEGSDPSFEYLKVIAGTTIDKVTIKAGLAIDKNLNIIDVPADLVDELDIPGDSVTRYIIIKYVAQTREVGTVEVDINGTLTGTNTLFTKKLRGLPDFPTKIRFPDSGTNTAEYPIQSVTDDLNAQLNIASGQMTAESDLEYEIVGTFTPGLAIPGGDKFPFRNDGYEIRLDVSDTVIADEEFILAQVVSDGVFTTIIDRRSEALASLNVPELEAPTVANPLIGIEFSQYNTLYHPKDTNRVKVGWGFKSSTGNWAYSSVSNQIVISLGSGGAWQDTNAFTPGDFDEWQVFFKETGAKVGVLTSTNAGSDIVLQLEPVTSVPTTSDIVVVPKASLVEISFATGLAPNSADKVIFDASLGEGICEVHPFGLGTIFSWRHINGLKTTAYTLINDGGYLNESSFNDLGTQIASNYSSVTGGTALLLGSPENFYIAKAWLDRSNTYAGMEHWSRGSDDTFDPADDLITLAEDGNFFEITMNDPDVYYMSTKSVGTIVALRLSAGSSSVLRFHISGGPGFVFGGQRFDLNTAISAGETWVEFAANDVLYFISSSTNTSAQVWSLLGTASGGSIGRQMTQVWNEINVATVVPNEGSTGGSTDVPFISGPLAGSYVRYKVVGRVCHVEYNILGAQMADYSSTEEILSVKIPGLPASRDQFNAVGLTICTDNNNILAGPQPVGMEAGGTTALIRTTGMSQGSAPNTYLIMNREYQFSAAQSIVLVPFGGAPEPTYNFSGTFTYEIQ